MRLEADGTTRIKRGGDWQRGKPVSPAVLAHFVSPDGAALLQQFVAGSYLYRVEVQATNHVRRVTLHRARRVASTANDIQRERAPETRVEAENVTSHFEGGTRGSAFETGSGLSPDAVHKLDRKTEDAQAWFERATATPSPIPLPEIEPPEVMLEPQKIVEVVPLTAPSKAVVAQGEPQWYHAIGGQETGPMLRAAIEGLARSGILKPDTLVWCEGWDDWEEAGQTELASLIRERKPVAAAPTASATAAVQTTDSGKDYQRNVNSNESPSALFHERPDTWFDTLMTSIPGIVWVGIGLFLCFLVYAVGMRAYNSVADQGDYLAYHVLQQANASAEWQAHDIELIEMQMHVVRGYDKSRIVSVDRYIGKGTYNDGGDAQVEVKVKSWDWLNRPFDWSYEIRPGEHPEWGPNVGTDRQ